MFVEKQIVWVIVVCFVFEYGLSTSVDSFCDNNNTQNLEYNYSVNELLFYRTNDILMLREKDADSHSPSLFTSEPSDMTNQKKKAYLTDNAKRQRNEPRKELQKARKAKGRPRLAHEVYFSPHQKR